MAGPSLSCWLSEHTLEQPFSNARGSWRQRSTLSVRLDANDAGQGARGYGEAAPLPGYSGDDVESCERALRGVTVDRLSELAASTTAAEVMELTAAAVPEHVPAARFALETAALDRLGQATRRPLWSLLGDVQRGDVQRGDVQRGDSVSQRQPFPFDAARSVPLCALLPSNDATRALQMAEQLVSDGVRAFKLKVGPGRLHASQERTLDAVRGALGSSIELRVDANQSFQRATFEATLEDLARYEPAFIEEPLERPLPAELASMPCGFALDESLQGMSAETVRSFLVLPACRALVLKPTLLGGFGRCLELERLARAHARAVVVSHTLEGFLGFVACLHLALALASDAAAGLWPLSHQLSDAEPVVLSNGRFAAPGRPGLGVSP